MSAETTGHYILLLLLYTSHLYPPFDHVPLLIETSGKFFLRFTRILTVYTLTQRRRLIGVAHIIMTI